MNKLFQHIGSLALGGFGTYYFYNPVKPDLLLRPIPSQPPTVHIHTLNLRRATAPPIPSNCSPAS